MINSNIGVAPARCIQRPRPVKIMRVIVYFFLIIFLSLPGVPAAQENGISLDQAVKRIKQQRDVKVLSAERVTRDGAPMYRIKVLTDSGRVKYIWVNPGG